MMGGGVRLCLEKMGVMEPDEFDSREIDIGTKAEGLVLDAYEHHNNTTLMARSLDTLYHPELNWLGAHLDALQSPTKNVEAKTVGFWMRSEWGDGADECPQRVIWQVQEQMVVTGATVTDVPVCFINEDTLKDLFLGNIPKVTTYVVPADEELQYRLVKAAQHVWDCVLTKTMPEPETLADVDILYRKDNGGEIECDDDIFRLYEEAVKVHEIKVAAEKQEKQLKLQLKDFMRDAAALRYGRSQLATWKKSADGWELDDDALAAAHPDIYKKFLVPKTGSRRFLLKEMKQR